MTTEATTAHDLPATTSAPKRGFLPRLGSALAFVPLGVYTTWHLWQNMSAWQGAAAWEQHVTQAHAPIAEFTMSTIVILPIILHMIWGIRRMTIVRPNFSQYPTFDNLKFVLQRLSAIGLIGFLGAHIWLARLHPLIETGRHETFADISWHMRHHPPTLVVYILGVLGIAYHLANGVATDGMTWGYAASPKAKARMGFISMSFFVVLLAMGFGAIYALWDAGAAQRAEIREAHSAQHDHIDQD
jgi:succinate dehydrogenase / fumarate reductase cytochrome b subunit